MNERAVTRPQQSKRKRNADQASSRLLLDNQLDCCPPRYADAPATPIDKNAVRAIHDASMTILENLGVLFLNDAALSIFESKGCQVERDSKRVRMDRARVMEHVAKATAHMAVTPRNPDRMLIFDGSSNRFLMGKKCPALE